MTLGCFYEVLIRVPARSSSRIQVRYKHYGYMHRMSSLCINANSRPAC